MISLVVEQKE